MKRQDSDRATRPRGRKKKTEVKYLTEQQVEALFRAITDLRDRAIFRIAYHRGLRAREVGMLQVSDFRTKTERLYVHRLKGSNSGEYHLTAHEVRALKAWLKVRGWEPGVLFPSRRGRGISQQMLDVLMKRYGAAAGVPAELRHFHVLKHSCATHLFARGEHVEDVQDHLGHVNIQNTMIYAKITNRRRDERGARLKDW